ncbi:hypothetical protein [Streptomyces sp. NPDC026092]|uniref:hypothetical protein n=1 Tax=Streptomyces sp. NPDC026092 TaxID=3154797 RepID=UPI0033EDD377
MYGSPTILIDGTDPFAPPGAVPSLSCRLYRNPDGAVSGVPDESALRWALAGATPQVRDAGASECCTPQPPDALDVVGRGGRGRRAPAENGLRAVHQEILRHFAVTGVAPEAQVLQPVAAAAGRNATEVLAERRHPRRLPVLRRHIDQTSTPLSRRTRWRVRTPSTPWGSRPCSARTP